MDIEGVVALMKLQFKRLENKKLCNLKTQKENVKMPIVTQLMLYKSIYFIQRFQEILINTLLQR